MSSDTLMVALRVKGYVKSYLAKSGMKQGHLAEEIGYTQKNLAS